MNVEFAENEHILESSHLSVGLSVGEQNKKAFEKHYI